MNKKNEKNPEKYRCCVAFLLLSLFVSFKRTFSATQTGLVYRTVSYCFCFCVVFWFIIKSTYIAEGLVEE